MQQVGEKKALTGLRGVAACMVVVYHSLIGFGLNIVLLNHGYMAVDVFFVLSGFVMALTYGKEFCGRFGPKTYLGFVYKRFGRVYPLYFVVTLVTMLCIRSGWVGGYFTARTALANILLVQKWGSGTSLVGPAWSISTEFVAYLLFPALAAGVLAAGWRWPLAAGALALLVLIYIATRSTAELGQIYGGVASRYGPLDIYGGKSGYAVLRCLAGFVFGLLAFRLTQWDRAARLAAVPLVGDVLTGLILVALAVAGTDVGVVVLMSPFIMTLAAGRSWAARILQTKAVYWLGLISYSTYLTHMLVRDLAGPAIFRAVTALHAPHAYILSAVLPIVVIIPLSAVCFYTIEKPARTLSRRLVWRRTSRSAAAPAKP